MKAKLTEQEKFLAYVLNKHMNFQYTMARIGLLMNVSQSTISNAIKEVEYLRVIRNLEQELMLATQLAQENFEQKNPVVPFKIKI